MPFQNLCIRSLSRLKSRNTGRRLYNDDKSDRTLNRPKQPERKPFKLYGVNANQDVIKSSSKISLPCTDIRKLERELIHRIKLSGPITVAQYMQEVLTNPLSGYYIGSKVFGTRGDFVTSPEISQMFGECIAIWLLNEWYKMGKPKPLQIVELGPGRGTLMQDICRTIFKLAPKEMSEEAISLHLVEISNQMRQIQESTLCGYFHGHSHSQASLSKEHNMSKSDKMFEHKAVTKYGQHIYWYSRIEDVPKGFSFYLAHEFFDALPIHKFVKTKDGHWREILIDIDEQNNKLRFVQANFPTPALHAVNFESNSTKNALEVSPKAGVIIQHISDRIDKFGGGALIADYGENFASEDSFRGFKEHKLHDVLEDPGGADLTADVDFSYICRQCSEHTMFYGPVTQSKFLKAIGIEIRYKKLTETTGSIDNKDLDLAYHSLTDQDKMGKRFKFCSIFPKTMLPIHQKYPPAGFENEK